MAKKNYSVITSNVGKIYTLKSQFSTNFLQNRYQNDIKLNFELEGMSTTNGTGTVPCDVYGIKENGEKILYMSTNGYYLGIDEVYYVNVVFSHNNNYVNYEVVIDLTQLPKAITSRFFIQIDNTYNTKITDFNFDSGNTDIGADILFNLTRDSATALYAPYVKVTRSNGQSINCVFDTENNKFTVPGFLKATTETLTVSFMRTRFAKV